MKTTARGSTWLPPILHFALMALAATALAADAIPPNARRGMTYMDILEMRAVGSPAVSPDGKWLLHTLTVPDWKAAKSYSDIFVVSTEQGVASSRQMTFTKNKNETSPRWSRDGKFFVFLSNRDAAAGTSGPGGGASAAAASGGNQLYLMRPDGGEARKLTEAKDGVNSFAFSRDGRWLAYSSGKDEEQQIWGFSIGGIETEPAKQLVKHATPISSWQFAPDSRRLYFVAPSRVDKANKDRKEKKFDVRIRNEETASLRLWSFDLETKQATALTTGEEYSVGDVTIAKDSGWIGFHGTPNDRYRRNVTEAPDYADLYLLEAATGKIERLTTNQDIAESPLSFSPDSQWIAFSAADDLQFFRNSRVYLRAVKAAGEKWKKLGDNLDADVSVGSWSADSKTIYFNAGVRAANHFFALATETGKVRQISQGDASLSVSQDDDSQTWLVRYADPTTPSDYHAVSSPEQIGDRAKWRKLTASNPQVAKLALGETELVRWKSTDGKMVEGILVKPVGYEKEKRYPLVVQIHGGPQSAVVMGFDANHSYYAHVYAAAGYVCFQPNYRGSSNYGERHRMEIGGDYFRQGFDDIMTGVDHLIAQGIADGDKLGAMGWSAGGHWSNWILTHSDRFKAISSGAGAVNWISMYAQSDVQRTREFYYGGKPPYDDFSKYWDVSPLKFIRNAKTPTLIHVVDGDPRVPRPQSEELHMALKKLGVPTELLVYPGTTHGIAEPRNQLVKMVAEFNWFEKYLKGKAGWFDWKELLATVKDEKAEKKEPAGSPEPEARTPSP